jgi:epsilon-lactone hydrolase
MQGPTRPTWSWFLELGTEVLRRHIAAAFKMPNITAAREYLDSFLLDYPVESHVEIVHEVRPSFRGDWFIPLGAAADLTLLYFHGGGYSFYPKAYANFISLIAESLQCRTFALDYRLTPEHRYPAQLEDALNAYRWLLKTGCQPESVAFGGDSAGGHLTLTALLSLRDSELPLPAFAIALSPATDFATEYPSITANESFDWIDSRMLTHWAGWFCDEGQRCEPVISPLRADLRRLPPLYIQAGRAEILFDSIRAFANCARAQGADVVLESWCDMNHVFQMFGPDVPQSAEALGRLRDFSHQHMRKHKTTSLSRARS